MSLFIYFSICETYSTLSKSVFTLTFLQLQVYPKQSRSGAADTAPLLLKLNIPTLGAFLCCPLNLGQFSTGTRGAISFPETHGGFTRRCAKCCGHSQISQSARESYAYVPELGRENMAPLFRPSQHLQKRFQFLRFHTQAETVLLLLRNHQNDKDSCPGGNRARTKIGAQFRPLPPEQPGWA